MNLPDNFKGADSALQNSEAHCMTNLKNLALITLIALSPFILVAQNKNDKFEYKLLTIEKDRDSKFLENYRKGAEHYNKAVDIVQKADYDSELSQLENVQHSATDAFKLALPYLENAYKINPKDEETLVGLAGIYFALGDNDKSIKYRQELELLQKK